MARNRPLIFLKCSVLEKQQYPNETVSKPHVLYPKGGFPKEADTHLPQAIVMFLPLPVVPTANCDQSLAKRDCHGIPRAFRYPWSCFKVQLGVFRSGGKKV